MSTREDYEKLSRLISPEVLKENLVKAAVFIIAYEFLENLLKDRLACYYALIMEGDLGSDTQGDFKPGEKYAEEVRARCKDDLLIASCRWLEAKDVLTNDDVEFIKTARKHRCDLVHETPNILLRAGEQVDIRGLERVCEIAYRVDNWWLVTLDDASPETHSLGAIVVRYLSEVLIEGRSPNARIPGPM